MPRELRLNVRDLIATAGEFQPQDDWKWTAVARAQAGTETHSKYLAQRQAASEDFRKEVWLSQIFEWRGYRVTLQGRLDGMRRSPAGWIVEEIKSLVLTAHDLELCELDPAHAEQCGLYCLLLEMQAETVVDGEVVYVSTRDGSARAIGIQWERAAFEALLDERLAKYTRRLEEDERFADWRRLTADRLALPFAPRAPQEIMLRDVEGAAREGLNLLCSAPTGTGKTAGALLPMTRATLLANGRLFFVTSRVSQQELALETLAALGGVDSGKADAPLYGLGMQLRAKERSCPMEVMRCIDGVCPFLTDFAERSEQSGIVDDLAREGVIHADRITEVAVQAELCPFEVSLALAGRSTVIVADYNYVFDPRVYLRRFFAGGAQGSLTRRRFLIVDEAHNLPDRARDYYSPELDIRAMEGLIEDCRSLSIAPLGFVRPERDVFARAAALFEEFCDAFYAGLLRFAEEQGDSNFYVERPDGDFAGDGLEARTTRIQEVLAMYFAFLASDSAKGGGPAGLSHEALPFRVLAGRQYRDQLLETLYSCLDFCRSLAADSELFAYVWHTAGRWQCVCLDPAPFLGRRMRDSFFSVLGMSATLTPFEFFGRQLGLEDALHLELRGVFAAGHRRTIACTSVDTRLKYRQDYVPEIARIMARAMEERRGNYLAFFPSFAFRDQVAAALPDALTSGSLRLIHQTPAMPAEMVLRMLRRAASGTTLLLAVHGGVFAEGVDFPDDMAIGAFVVGPGLPQLSIERQLIREYYDNRELDGFDFAFVHPGINRSVQAGGRVIRTETDRGFVLLLDARFAQERYFQKLPATWREEILWAEDGDAALRLVREFWKSQAY